MSPSILSSFPPWSLNQKCVLGMAEGPNQDDTKRGGHSACYLLLQRPKLAEADSDHPAMRQGLAVAGAGHHAQRGTLVLSLKMLLHRVVFSCRR